MRKRPWDKTPYPANWGEIRGRILDRAGGRCECFGECGLHTGRRCVERNRTAALYAKGKIVLTVAHLDHTPAHCRDGNLKAMCPRCHLRYDRGHHYETRIGAVGHPELFPKDEGMESGTNL